MGPDGVQLRGPFVDSASDVTVRYCFGDWRALACPWSVMWGLFWGQTCWPCNGSWAKSHWGQKCPQRTWSQLGPNSWDTKFVPPNSVRPWFYSKVVGNPKMSSPTLASTVCLGLGFPRMCWHSLLPCLSYFTSPWRVCRLILGQEKTKKWTTYAAFSLITTYAAFFCWFCPRWGFICGSPGYDFKFIGGHFRHHCGVILGSSRARRESYWGGIFGHIKATFVVMWSLYL